MAEDMATLSASSSDASYDFVDHADSGPMGRLPSYIPRPEEVDLPLPALLDSSAQEITKGCIAKKGGTRTKKGGNAVSGHDNRPLSRHGPAAAPPTSSHAFDEVHGDQSAMLREDSGMKRSLSTSIQRAFSKLGRSGSSSRRRPRRPETAPADSLAESFAVPFERTVAAEQPRMDDVPPCAVDRSPSLPSYSQVNTISRSMTLPASSLGPRANTTASLPTSPVARSTTAISGNRASAPTSPARASASSDMTSRGSARLFQARTKQRTGAGQQKAQQDSKEEGSSPVKQIELRPEGEDIEEEWLETRKPFYHPALEAELRASVASALCDLQTSVPEPADISFIVPAQQLSISQTLPMTQVEAPTVKADFPALPNPHSVHSSQTSAGSDVFGPVKETDTVAAKVKRSTESTSAEPDAGKPCLSSPARLAPPPLPPRSSSCANEGARVERTLEESAAQASTAGPSADDAEPDAKLAISTSRSYQSISDYGDYEDEEVDSWEEGEHVPIPYLATIEEEEGDNSREENEVNEALSSHRPEPQANIPASPSAAATGPPPSASGTWFVPPSYHSNPSLAGMLQSSTSLASLASCVSLVQDSATAKQVWQDELFSTSNKSEQETHDVAVSLMSPPPPRPEPRASIASAAEVIKFSGSSLMLSHHVEQGPEEVPSRRCSGASRSSHGGIHEASYEGDVSRTSSDDMVAGPSVAAMAAAGEFKMHSNLCDFDADTSSVTPAELEIVAADASLDMQATLQEVANGSVKTYDMTALNIMQDARDAALARSQAASISLHTDSSSTTTHGTPEISEPGASDEESTEDELADGGEPGYALIEGNDSGDHWEAQSIFDSSDDEVDASWRSGPVRLRKSVPAFQQEESSKMRLMNEFPTPKGRARPGKDVVMASLSSHTSFHTAASANNSPIKAPNGAAFRHAISPDLERRFRSALNDL